MLEHTHDSSTESDHLHRSDVLRSVGLGLITGASDDDPSAIGTYASAGAKFGPSLLWTAPVMFPMMFAVVYLSSKLGQVSGKGLFEVIHDYYPRWILHVALIGVLIGNTCEAAADLGGMAAALNVLVPIPIKWITVPVALSILALQLWGSYTLIRDIFRWLVLSLLAYVAAAFFSKPDWAEVIKDTLIPHLHFNRESLAMVVAIIGTSLSAYIYTWQSNIEVEEEIEMGRAGLSERWGATEEELRKSRVDVFWGMLFASVVMYFIILSTNTLFKAGRNDITTAAEAAQALKPLAGNAAGFLFAVGVVAVGFLAVPIMTTGAAYDISQTAGWTYGLHKKPAEAKAFYIATAAITLVAMSLNFIGINPIKALVWAGIVQGFSTPPLMLLILLMTNRRDIMGEHVNGRAMNVLGWITTIAIFSASVGLIVTWII